MPLELRKIQRATMILLINRPRRPARGHHQVFLENANAVKGLAPNRPLTATQQLQQDGN